MPPLDVIKALSARACRVPRGGGSVLLPHQTRCLLLPMPAGLTHVSRSLARRVAGNHAPLTHELAGLQAHAALPLTVLADWERTHPATYPRSLR